MCNVNQNIGIKLLTLVYH